MTVTEQPPQSLQPPSVDLSAFQGPLNEELAKKIDARARASLTDEKLRSRQRETVAENERDREAIQDDLWRVLTPTDEWFRSMLRGFLLVYVVALATIMAWFRTSTSHARLVMIPALLLPTIYQFAMRPISRRIALRGILRRPTTKATAIALAVSSLVLAASLVMSDAVRQTQDRALQRNLGPVDAILVSPTAGDQLKALAAIDARESLIEVSQRRGTHSIKQSTDGQLMFVATTSYVSTQEGKTLGSVDAIELDIEQAKQFGGDRAATGLEHQSPLPDGSALIGADLADELRAGRGTVLTVRSDGTIVQVTVAGVLPRKGFGALTLDGRPRPRVMLLPPGVLSTGASALPGRVRHITAYSLAGKPDNTWKRSQGFTETLRQVLSGEATAGPAALPALPTNTASGEGDGAISASPADSPPTDEPVAAATRIDGYATALKADFRDTVNRSVNALAPISSGLAAIAGLSAGASLAMALWLTIRRRQQELHALRAIGLSRSDAFGILTIELALVSLLAVCVGSVLGWVVARLALGRVRPPGKAFGDLALDLSVLPRSAALSTALATSFLICMLTIFAGGVTQIRGWVSGGLRRRATAGGVLPRWIRVGAGLAALVGLYIMASNAWNRHGVAMLVGLCILAVSLRVLAPYLPGLRETAVRSQVATGFGITAFALAAVGLAGTVLGSLTSASFTLFASVLLLLSCIALPNGLIERCPAPVRNVLRSAIGPLRSLRARISDSGRRVLDESLAPKTEDGTSTQTKPPQGVNDALVNVLNRAQVSRSPLHGNMIRIICALAVFSSVASAVLNASVQHSIRKRAAESSGRFSAVVYGADTGAVNGIKDLNDVAQLIEVASSIGLLSDQSHAAVRVRVASPDENYASGIGVAKLSKRAAQYATDEDAFKAVAADSTLAIVDASVLSEGASMIGQRVFLADAESQRSTSLTVVAITRATAGLGDVVVNRSALNTLRNDRPSPTTSLVYFGEGLSSEAGIANIQTSFDNLEVHSFADVAKQNLRGLLTIASLLTQLSRILLLGGLAAGIVVLRSALADRKRDLAGLRALGATDHVLSAVISREYRTSARTGAIVGLALGVLAAWRLISTSSAGLALSLPLLRIAVLLLVFAIIARVVLWATTRATMQGAPADVLRSTS